MWNQISKFQFHKRATILTLMILLLMCSFEARGQANITCKRGNRLYQRQLESSSQESDALKLTQRILQLFSLPSNLVKVQSAIVPNAEVCYDDDDHTYRILFDASLFSKIDQSNPDGWVKIAILAHEVGHVIRQDPIREDFESNKQYEIAADEFTGQLLAKYGIELPRTLALYDLQLMKVGGYVNTTYPSIDQRRAAAEEGWRKAHDPNLNWRADDKSLGHAYGHNSDGTWVSTAAEAERFGKVMYMTFGPYIKLPPGSYKVSFLYRCKKEKEWIHDYAIQLQVSEFDAPTGNQRANSWRDVPLNSCDDSITVSSWIFSVSDVSSNTKTFEFRVYCYPNSQVSLRDITVEKILTF